MPPDAATPDGLRKAAPLEDTLRPDSTACFSDDAAAAYISNSMEEPVRDAMRVHLDSCEACRALVLFGARGLRTPDGSSIDARAETVPVVRIGEVPHRIGRFTILELIGAGGMGVVYSAFDNELDRKVALKVVRTELRDERPEATRQAMAREAKAMAKIDHPNVITVFEVGTHEDQIFVAMELVTGGDLRTWLRAKPAAWRDALGVCTQAGQGLAAAHRAGLVHRDFKPDNVLVGSDGRVRVTDFGLARAIGDATRPSYVTVAAAPVVRPSERLTRTGAVVGTPAYMAPEQHRGEPADARADQFAFCVTTWEALYGERPFAGDDFAAIATAARNGELRPAPTSSEVPPRVRDALARGLRADPAERFATMDELLAALATEAPSRRKWIAIAAIPSVIAIGLGIYVVARDNDRRSTCPTAESKLAGIWDAKRRADTQAAIRGAGAIDRSAGPRSGAEGRGGVFDELAKSVPAALDAYTARWAAAWGDACTARDTGEQSPTMFDLRGACLMRRLHAVDSIAAALAKQDPDVVSRAGLLVEGLQPIESCNAIENLAKAAPPPELFAKVAAIDDILEAAHTERMAGHMKRARELAEQGLADAERIGYKPSAAAALLTIARIEEDGGDYAAAETHLQRASTEAMSSSYDELVAEILTELADIIGYSQARPAEAHRLVEIARGAIGRIGNPPQYRIDLLITESRIALAESKHEPAVVALDEATKIANEIGDEMRLIPIVAAKHLIHLERGEFDEAFDLVQQELALRAKIEGKQHPNYASALESRSTVHFSRSAFEAGLADLAEARRIKTAALGADSPELLSIENNVGIIMGLLGDWDEALRSARACHAISEQHNGLEHPTTALAISNEGAALRDLGRLAEAEPLLLQQLDIRKRVLGTDHQDYAVGLTEVGELRLAQNRNKEAEQLFTDATAILVASIGEESPLIPYATWGLGVAQLRTGKTTLAKATLEKTLARFDELELDPVQNCETRLALGDALWKLGEKPKAREIVEATTAQLVKLPANSVKALRAKIATWLSSHR